MYGSKTWRIREQIKIKLEATEIDALRRAARTSIYSEYEMKQSKKKGAYKRQSETGLKNKI